MYTYGFEEKKGEFKRICPICKNEFIATTVRRRYCYSKECAIKRYLNQLQRKKAKWQLRQTKKGKKNETSK